MINRRTEPELWNMSYAVQSLWCPIFGLSLWSHHMWRLQGQQWQMLSFAVTSCNCPCASVAYVAVRHHVRLSLWLMAKCPQYTLLTEWVWSSVSSPVCLNSHWHWRRFNPQCSRTVCCTIISACAVRLIYRFLGRRSVWWCPLWPYASDVTALWCRPSQQLLSSCDRSHAGLTLFRCSAAWTFRTH